jgi:hypothetical protein
MSWSVSAIGKAPAVRERIATDLGKITCTEPEQTIKNSVGSAIDAALAAFPPGYAVRVEASGSQSHPDFSKAPHEKTNQLIVKLEPIWGFVE